MRAAQRSHLSVLLSRNLPCSYRSIACSPSTLYTAVCQHKKTVGLKIEFCFPATLPGSTCTLSLLSLVFNIVITTRVQSYNNENNNKYLVNSHNWAAIPAAMTASAAPPPLHAAITAPGSCHPSGKHGKGHTSRVPASATCGYKTQLHVTSKCQTLTCFVQFV